MIFDDLPDPKAIRRAGALAGAATNG